MDDLAQELIKAQAVERMARDDFDKAQDAWRVAQENVRKINTEIGRRAWVAAGVVMGETILYVQGLEQTKYLAGGVDWMRGDLVVHAQTKTGNWYERTNVLYRVKPSEIVIVGKGSK